MGWKMNLNTRIIYTIGTIIYCTVYSVQCTTYNIASAIFQDAQFCFIVKSSSSQLEIFSSEEIVLPTPSFMYYIYLMFRISYLEKVASCTLGGGRGGGGGTDNFYSISFQDDEHYHLQATPHPPLARSTIWNNFSHDIIQLLGLMHTPRGLSDATASFIFPSAT